MPDYKLVYFNARGRAELIRWIFTYADIPFTDERIEMSDWPGRKSSIPGGKLPVLMVDGEALPQSLSIARYAARIGGLAPEDPFQSAHCDALADTLSDMMTEVYKVMFAKGDKEEQAKKFKEEVYPNHVCPLLARLESRLKTRDYFITDKLTWSDLMICLVFSGMVKKNPEVLKPYPVVEKHVNKICVIPKIKAWNDAQPETPF
ncbi:hypothetical protein SK128_007052 [Halocaridina rubra]|uniref:glutathione transferase n=1 Tax=Halocaridina rubra TaxID=373956 RepID=A0AAN8X446_HALRR